MTSMWFDDLNLLLAGPEEEAAAIAADGFFFEVAGKDDGSELTNAEAIVSSVTSDLFDGASHEVTGWESASLPLRVQVVSPTPSGLASGVARLIATCRKPGIRPLSFALQDSAPVSVFDVLVATWKLEFDDLDPQQRQRCTYTLTLRCKPFARSESPVSLPGLAVGGAYSETVVATGASTTGWSTTSRYVTRRNLTLLPSFETSGTSYSPWTLGSRSTSATKLAVGDAPSGSKVLRVTAGAMAPGANATSYMNSATMSVTAGQAYPIQARIKAGHSAMTLAGILIRWYDGAGTKIGSDDVTTVAGSTSSYATVSVSKTAPAGATMLQVFPFVQVNASINAGQFWYLDNVAGIDLETVATTTYFDGDTPAAGGLTYYWGSSQGTSGVSIETGLGAVTASGGTVFPRGSSSTVPVIHVPSAGGINLTYTGSINVSSHRYLRIKTDTPVGVKVDGIDATHVASGTQGSYFLYYWQVPDSVTSAATTVRLERGFMSDWSAAPLKVAEIATVSHPTVGTGRTITRNVTTVGTMPAEATIKVTNNGNPLGDHLVVYSGSNTSGFTALRTTRTTGPTQAAASGSISGLTSTLATTEGAADTFQIAVNQIPEATYLLSAFLTGAGLTNGTAYTFSYRASVVEDPSGTPVEHSVVTGSQKVTATGTTFSGKPVDLGLLNLPTTDIAVTGTNSAVVQIKLWVSAGTWTLDEAWLADFDNGQLSTINFAEAGLSGKVTTLEIIPAAADRPQQQYLATSGAGANTTVREIVPTGWAAHRFDPADGDAQVNVVNTATTPGLSVAIEFFARWDVYAAPIVSDTEV